MLSELETAIIDTMVFFEIWQRPLSADEVYRFLWSKKSYAFATVQSTLREMVSSGRLMEREAYYHLPTSTASVGARDQSLRYSISKQRRARFALWLLAGVPFVRMIGVTNTVAAETAHAASDLDLLIVVASERLWIARLLVLVILDLFRLRPRAGKTARAICPCFFVSEKSLDMESLVLGSPDIYFQYWMCQIVPVYDAGSVHHELLQRNAWVKRSIPEGLRDYTPIPAMLVRLWWWQRVLKKFFETAWQGAYGRLITAQAKEIQRERLNRSYGELAQASDTRVIIRDDMVKLHQNDRRAYYREAWQKRRDELHKSL